MEATQRRRIARALLYKNYPDTLIKDVLRLMESFDIAKGEKGEKGERGTKGERGATGAKGEKGDRGEKGERGERGERGPVGRSIFGGKGEPGKDGSPDTPEQVRDKLETLAADERLSHTAIRGLEEEIAKLRKDIAAKSSGGVRRIYQPYVERFTHLTDGTTKTFYLKREPLKTDTIMVFGTDWPIILDPTVDFTVSGKALTLAAGIPAPSAGASVVISYHA